MRIALATSPTAPARNVETTWPELVAELSTHAVRGSRADLKDEHDLDRAKIGPCFMLGPLVDGVHTKRASDMFDVQLLTVDLDEVTHEQLGQVINALDPYAWCFYTTHRFDPASGLVRGRFVLPLAEPLKVSDFPAAWRGLQKIVGGLGDEQTKNPNRLNYMPSTYDPAVALVDAHEGRPITFADLASTEAIVPRETTQAATSARLHQIHTAMRRLRRVEVRDVWRLINKGEAFAGEGARHSAMLDATWELARRFANVTDAELEALFAPSLLLMGEGAPTLADVITAYKGALEKQENKKQEDKEDKDGYSQEELEDIANKQKCTVAELDRRWVVQATNSFYFLQADGSYSAPLLFCETTVGAAKLLARAPVETSFTGKNGGTRRKKIEEIVIANGDTARTILVDLTAQHSTFDPRTNTMHEAPCQLRFKPGDAKYDQKINEWLELLCDGPWAPKLLDWIAVFPDLDKTTCALYLAGPGGVGKNLLAHGLASLWSSGGPTEIDRVLENFNEDLTKCPLVFADEALPKTWRGESVTTKLRSMISIKERTLSRKYRSPAQLIGAVRLILAANDEFLLDSKGAATAESLDAIAKRFLFIPVSKRAERLMTSLPRDLKEYWKTEGIARHCLWLAANRQVELGGRFAVEGETQAMHRALMSRSEVNSLVLEWLVRYCLDPQRVDQAGLGLMRREGGKLYVNAQAVVDGWTHYLKTKVEPQTQKVQTALRSMSTDRVQKSWRGRTNWYRVIDTVHLFDWIEANGIGDVDSVRISLNPSINGKGVHESVVPHGPIEDIETKENEIPF